MKIIPTIVQPLFLLLMSSMMATHPATAEDHHLQIGANATSATLQLCGSKEACKSIHFSTIIPKSSREDIESIDTQEPETKPSLMDKINVLLFGL